MAQRAEMTVCETISCTTVTELVSWYFEPSQPQRITSGLSVQQTVKCSDTIHMSPGDGMLCQLTYSPRKYSSTRMFGIFSPLTCVQPTWPLRLAAVH